MTSNNRDEARKLLVHLATEQLHEGTGVLIPWEPTVDMIAELLDRIDELEVEVCGLHS